MEETRAGLPFGRWLGHGSEPWVGGGAVRAIHATMAPGWRVRIELQEGVGVCGWREPQEEEC